MKINALLSAFLLALFLGLPSCSKDPVPNIAACSEATPTDEICAAYFTRWFYNIEKNKCEQIGYSGCTQRGFETEQECLECVSK